MPTTVQRDVDEAAAEAADVAAPTGTTRAAKPNTSTAQALLTRATTLSPMPSMLRCPDTLARFGVLFSGLTDFAHPHIEAYDAGPPAASGLTM